MGVAGPVSTDGACLVVRFTSFHLQTSWEESLPQEVLHSMQVDNRQQNEEELLQENDKSTTTVLRLAISAKQDLTRQVLTRQEKWQVDKEAIGLLRVQQLFIYVEPTFLRHAAMSQVMQTVDDLFH